jgi:heme oxygenase
MDDAPVDEAMVAQIVQEANEAFGTNMEMFQELEGNLVKAIGQMLFNTLTNRRRRGSTELATAE